MDSAEMRPLINLAQARTQESLATAERLRDDGHYGPAVVWAVRSVEIFMKEVVLTPLFLDAVDADWVKAMRKAAKLFDPSEWRRALHHIQNEIGPLDRMVTTEGEDAYLHWAGPIVRLRGDIVHGRRDADEETARLVVGYARQLVVQLNLRLMVSGKHAMHDQLMDLIKAMQDAMGGPIRDTGDGPSRWLDAGVGAKHSQRCSGQGRGPCSVPTRTSASLGTTTIGTPGTSCSPPGVESFVIERLRRRCLRRYAAVLTAPLSRATSEARSRCCNGE